MAGQKQGKALKSQRNQKWRALLDPQDEVDWHRDELISQIEGKLQQRVDSKKLFVLRMNIT